MSCVCVMSGAGHDTDSGADTMHARELRVGLTFLTSVATLVAAVMLLLTVANMLALTGGSYAGRSYVVDEPVVDELVVDEPVADEPVADDLVADELVADIIGSRHSDSVDLVEGPVKQSLRWPLVGAPHPPSPPPPSPPPQ